MPTYTRVLLDQATLSTGDALDAADALDLGDYQQLEIVAEVTTAANGDAPLLHLRHGPTAAAGLDFETPISIDLSAAGTSWHHADRFSRWLSWTVSGTLDTSAVVTIHVIAKA